MKFLVTALILGALAASSASANPFARNHRGVINGSITVPPEWAGIWQSVDSTYDCNGAFQNTTTFTDTLCAGVTFESDTTFSCTGSADANSYTQHCTGSGEVFTDCTYTFDLTTHGTRSGDSFFSVSVFSTTYTGTGKGCDFFPDSCTQTNSHSTRLGPAPAAYCATPVESTSWGRVKSLYR
jgi:hypothetical protein